MPKYATQNHLRTCVSAKITSKHASGSSSHDEWRKDKDALGQLKTFEGDRIGSETSPLPG